jgi:hypothetical protein
LAECADVSAKHLSTIENGKERNISIAQGWSIIGIPVLILGGMVGTWLLYILYFHANAPITNRML